MKVRLLHPITHDGVHYSRGIHDVDDDTGQALLGVHSSECTAFEAPNPAKRDPGKPTGECRNHSAVPFIELDPVMGKATPAPDAKKNGLAVAPPEAKIPEPPAPDSSVEGKATPAPDAPATTKSNGKK